jgi:hypothetical protein
MLNKTSYQIITRTGDSNLLRTMEVRGSSLGPQTAYCDASRGRRRSHRDSRLPAHRLTGAVRLHTAHRQYRTERVRKDATKARRFSGRRRRAKGVQMPLAAVTTAADAERGLRFDTDRHEILLG